MKIETEISDDTIRGLLCNAFEGGSNDWYVIRKYILPKGAEHRDYRDGGARQPSKSYWHISQIVPLEEGGALLIGDLENPKAEPLRLDRNTIKRGLHIMAEKYPQHWGDALSESQADAITGDVFLQCCLFGEIVYG